MHKVLRVITPCRSVDELATAFAPRVDADSLILATTLTRPVGARLRFDVQLADGSSALCGEGEVIDVEPGRRMRLRLGALTAPSRAVHARILGRRRAATPRPLVRIPERDPAPPPPMPDTPSALVPIPPLPAPVLPTSRVALAWAFGEPPEMPTERAAVTARIHGVAPPVTRGPRVRIERTDGVPEPIYNDELSSPR